MISKYSSNVGKAIFLGWIRSLISILVGIIIALIVFGTLKNWIVALVIFLFFPFAVWILDALIRWKSFRYDGNELVLKRNLRPTHRFNIHGYIFVVRYTEHSLFFWSIFAEPTIRLIDNEGNITDIRCSFMTKDTADKMISQIRIDQRRYGQYGEIDSRMFSSRSGNNGDNMK